MKHIQDIEKLTKGLVEKFSPVQILLFGSQANNTASEESDIDLCVIADIEEENSRNYRRNIRSYIHKKDGLAYLEKPVDIVLYTPRQFEHAAKIKGTLANVVKEEGVLLYG